MLLNATVPVAGKEPTPLKEEEHEIRVIWKTQDSRNQKESVCIVYTRESARAGGKKVSIQDDEDSIGQKYTVAPRYSDTPTSSMNCGWFITYLLWLLCAE